MLGSSCSPCCATRANCLDITLSGFSWTTPDLPPEAIGEPWRDWGDKKFNYNQKSNVYATDSQLDTYDAGGGLPFREDLVLYGWINELGPQFSSIGFQVQFILTKSGDPASNSSGFQPMSSLTLNFAGVQYVKQALGFEGVNPFKSPVTFTPSDVTGNLNAALSPGSITIQVSQRTNATAATVFDAATEVDVTIAPHSQHITFTRPGAPLVFTYTSADYNFPFPGGTNLSLLVGSVGCGGRERLYLSLTGQLQLNSSPGREVIFHPDSPASQVHRYRYLPPYFFGEMLSDATSWPALPITYYSGPTFREAFYQYNNITYEFPVVTKIDPSVTITIDSVS